VNQRRALPTDRDRIGAPVAVDVTECADDSEGTARERLVKESAVLLRRRQ
jgi:hypothetical protein